MGVGGYRQLCYSAVNICTTYAWLLLLQLSFKWMAVLARAIQAAPCRGTSLSVAYLNHFASAAVSVMAMRCCMCCKHMIVATLFERVVDCDGVF